MVSQASVSRAAGIVRDDKVLQEAEIAGGNWAATGREVQAAWHALSDRAQQGRDFRWP